MLEPSRFLGEQETNLQIIFTDGNSIVSGGREVHSDSFANDLVSDCRRKIAGLLELCLHIGAAVDKFTEISAAAIVLEVMAELHLVLKSRTFRLCLRSLGRMTKLASKTQQLLLREGRGHPQLTCPHAYKHFAGSLGRYPRYSLSLHPQPSLTWSSVDKLLRLSNFLFYL